ncbi:MAG: nucleoside triphosphate pyrophosphohydrolase [Thermodesulfovibrionia bacterium]|nr:nucleoside triphosphate pyrophosphohydrolase [Thermodesulfovibrionia bacterium]
MKLEELIKVVDRLRGPDGCPWDKEQTRDSLRPYLIEELYELLDAFDENDSDHIKEELGDLLLQIALHSQIAKEEGLFEIDDVIEGIVSKMVRRHPHVFGDKDFKTSADVSKWWEEHKRSEKKKVRSILDGVPKTLPSLLRAQELQAKASGVGFDWDNIEDVFKKLDEEVGEFKRALLKKDYSNVEDELGDIFFVLVSISNFVKVNPEDALRKTISKFIARFEHIERIAAERGMEVSDMKLSEMEACWNEAKGHHPN